MSKAEGMTDAELDEIEARAEKATPGPWGWFGNVRARSVYLATQFWGRHFVMQFARWGMNGAQPVFRSPLPPDDSERAEGRPAPAIMRTLSELVDADNGFLTADHNGEIVAVGHPDAVFIAAARTDVPRLVAEIRRLKAERLALAKLAADEPQFFNPLDAFAAQKIRDDVLAERAALAATTHSATEVAGRE